MGRRTSKSRRASPPNEHARTTMGREGMRRGQLGRRDVTAAEGARYSWDQRSRIPREALVRIPSSVGFLAVDQQGRR